MAANQTNYYLRERIYYGHQTLLRAGEDVSAADFARVFSVDGPPIGWHLWHIARFADKLEAKLAQVIDGEQTAEIWYRDEVTKRWEVAPDRLGVFESGMGQAHEDAQETIAQVGQDSILAYVRAAFEGCDSAVGKLTDADFEASFFGLYDYAYDKETGKVWATEPRASLVADDLMFHVNHASRHLGMMEALRGLLGVAGTISV
jgi:hypothetical protein